MNPTPRDASITPPGEPPGASHEGLRAHVVEQVKESIAEAKPHLRGWLHLALLPLTLAGGVVLVVLSPDGVTRTGSIVFVLSALMLFGVSAAYHRGSWSPQAWRVLRRLDHCNIFVLIAGSYTAYALLLLDSADTTVLLVIVWSSALLGVAARFVWPDAPRWLSPPVYVACGAAAVLFVPEFLTGASRLQGGAGVATLVLLGTGGALYIAGAVVYAFRRPDPWPRWFGFHEVFHAFTVLAFASHYAGITLATYSMR